MFKFSYPLIFLALQAPVDEIVELCRYVDCFAVSLIIPISYIGSNRRNMKKLISTFKFWNYCRKKTAVVSIDSSINPSSL
uniref:Secreted protein n=1 Tax=Caenorhabditis tropicalis TaxID=1561998 RepID=A0A1I7TH47_9PELO